jgi:phosphatidate cytidylyltransferase
VLKRTLSTLLLWSITLVLLYCFNDIAALWLIAALTGLTLYEFYSLLNHMGYDPFDKLGITLGVAVILAPYYINHSGLSRISLSTIDLVAFAVIVFSIRIILERNATNRVETLAASLFGITYVPVMLQYYVKIIDLHAPHAHTGIVYFLWVIAVSKFSDVGALLTGMAFGKHKMAPIISPKKTWEGAIGGLLISALVGAGIAYGAHRYLPVNFTPLIAALCALPMAALAVVADLIESVIKRRATIKDSGDAIPGIGGIFDVTDSLILTAPLGFMIFGLVK